MRRECYISKTNLKLTVMKTLLVIAVIFALVGVGFMIATLFTTGSELVLLSIGGGLALAAFVLVYLAYLGKSSK